jgi:undecaprenyl-diphosphatase
MAVALIVGGIVMWAVDVLCRNPRTLNMERMSLPQAIWIGAVQILSAVFPGTSRSMSTIAAGQTAGMSREAALEFSFFLCIPTMIAATGKELLDTIKESHQAATQVAATGAQQSLQLTAHQWGVLAVGFIVSFFVAWAVIAWFMHWVRQHGFIPFAIYRLILGLFVLFIAQR